MNTLAIRITVGGLATREAIIKYFTDFKCLITEEHLETNHHINVLLDTTVKVDTFRNKMNRFFHCVKNQSYCRLDKGNYCVYILKEDNLIQNTYCTDDELEQKKRLSYTKKDKPPSFHYSIVLNYPYKDPYAYPINEYIASYVIKSLGCTFHNSFDIQKIGNAIANKYYPDLYIKQASNYFFL